MFRFFSDFNQLPEINTNLGEKFVKFWIFANNKKSFFPGYKCYPMLWMYIDIDNNIKIYKNTQF